MEVFSTDIADAIITAIEDCQPPHWDVSSFKKLLGCGWDINENMGNFGDGLIRAVMTNKTPLVAFLLERGADPNLNLHGEEFTALEMASKINTDLDITSLLLQHGAAVKNRSAMLHAAQNGRIDVMSKLRDAGGSLNEAPNNSDIFDDRRRQADWGTPLHGAAAHGRIRAVKWLLANGASKECTNFLGLTAKKVANQQGFEEIEKLLV